MASFMSGMAGNVTAFNRCGLRHLPVIPQTRRQRSTLLWMAAWPRFCIAISVAAAYVATRFNKSWTCATGICIVNAPLFATFLLGFWKRATGHGAFVGLLSGTAAAMLPCIMDSLCLTARWPE